MNEESRRRNPWIVIGTVLFILSWIPFGFALLAVPFLPLNLSTKALVGGTCYIIGEISFGISVIILGKEVVSRYRHRLNPVRWFKDRESNDIRHDELQNGEQTYEILDPDH